jgi:diguanylate cyclase (GGDEF)-like protein
LFDFEPLSTKVSALNKYHRATLLLSHQRSETEFYIIVFGLIIGIASAGFCAIQVINQQYEYAVAIALHSITQIGLALYVLKTSKTAIAGGLLSLHMVVGTTTMVYQMGPELAYWAYPGFASIYLMTKPNLAMSLTITGYLVLGYLLWDSIALIEFTRIMLSLGITLAMGGMVLERKRRHTSKLTKLAHVDALTSVGNRRALDKRLAEVIDNYDATTDVCIMLIDLDHFKNINDKYGHPEGDQVLKKLTALLAILLGDSNQLYRYGGEEFVVLSNGDIDLSMHIAEKIRSTVSNTTFNNKTIKISIGLTALKNSDTPLSVIERADNALLTAKKQGRDQVYVSNV